ncbi:hypothetical protein Q5O89_24990 [Peribacillus frigoritolerans]|nr:hypothetical protein [Peribacillus frigoritolerans]
MSSNENGQIQQEYQSMLIYNVLAVGFVGGFSQFYRNLRPLC